MRNAFFNSLIKAAKLNKKLFLISVDQPTGFDSELKEGLGKRFLIEPISEANIIGMASGLAANGFIPIVFNHATFNSRRCYEQILLDSALQKRKIILVSMGAGLATSHLGPTHTSTDDIALMRLIPGMNIFNPCNSIEVSKIFPKLISSKSPCYLRLSKYGIPRYGTEINKSFFLNYSTNKLIHIKKSKLKSKFLFISTGIMTPLAMQAIETFTEKNQINLFHAPTINSLNDSCLVAFLRNATHLFVAEEHRTHGGFASALIDFITDNHMDISLPKIIKLGLPNNDFIHQYGDQESVLKTFGLDSEGIQKKLKKHI
jgi:transketolase